jgi:hypothetical protein
MQGREHPRSEREVVSVSEIVWNIGGSELAAGEEIAIEITADGGAQIDEVELIHVATVHGQHGGGKTMVDVVRIAIGGANHGGGLSGGKRACFGTVLGVERAEHVVVRSVFLNDENDVIDLLNAGRRLKLGYGDWGRGKQQKKEDSGATTSGRHDRYS